MNQPLQPRSCGVAADGAAYCWGVPGFQPAGGSSVTTGSATPVAGGLSFASAAAGGVHSCGITRGGEVFCWGVNASGQLGTAEPLDTCRYPFNRFESYPFACTGAAARDTCDFRWGASRPEAYPASAGPCRFPGG